MALKRSASRILSKSSIQALEESDQSERQPLPGRAFSRSQTREVEDGVVPAELKPWISKSFMQESVGVLVSDMSGYSQLAKKRGIIHFASVVIRLRQICLPILHHFGALLITFEADNFIAVFRTAAATVRAANAVQNTIQKYNASLPPESVDFSLTLNGIGADYGQGPLVDKNSKLHGKTFANAYALGEDLCEQGSVLLSANIRNELQRVSNPQFANATFTPKQYADPHAAMQAGSATGGLYTFTNELTESFSIPGADDNRYLPKDLMPLVRRHSFALSASDLVTLDKKIKDKYMLKRTALMFDFDYATTLQPAVQLRLEFECMAVIKGLLEDCHAYEVDDVLYFFEEPVEAVRAALRIQDYMSQQLEEFEGQGQAVLMKGFGIHTGEVLSVPGTDVHWGDPISMSSRLAQELATGGDILISDVVYNTVKNDRRLSGVFFEPQKLTQRGVTVCCYKAKDDVNEIPQLDATSAHQYCGWWRGLLPRMFCGVCCDKGSGNIFHDVTAEPILRS